MSLTAIILLILIGLILLIIEILFVPGMILGTIAVLMMITGIIFAFKDHGNTIGFTVLAGTGAATAAAVYWAFNSSIWKKMQVQSFIDGKANVIEEGSVKAGDIGKTISRLNPMGKALINNHQFEVQAVEGFIDENKEIEVIKVQGNKIWVKIKS